MVSQCTKNQSQSPSESPQSCLACPNSLSRLISFHLWWSYQMVFFLLFEHVKPMLTFGPLHFHSLVYSSLPWVFSGLALPFYSDFSSNLSSKENPFLTTQSNVSTTSNTHILNCFIFFIEIITLKLSYSWSVPHHLIDTQDDNFWSQFSLQRLYQGMDPQLICVNLQIILI